MELDDSIGEVHDTLALSELDGTTGIWKAAEAELNQAIALAPSCQLRMRIAPCISARVGDARKRWRNSPRALNWIPAPAQPSQNPERITNCGTSIAWWKPAREG